MPTTPSKQHYAINPASSRVEQLQKLSFPDLAKKFGQKISESVKFYASTDLDPDDDDAPLRPMADATIEKNLGVIKRMFALAASDQAIPTSPASNIVFNPRGIAETREPFKEEDISRLFSAPIWQGMKSLDQPNVPGVMVFWTADYWLPLIALHTGMRCEEIGQLLSSDIQESNGYKIIEINTLDPNGKRVKQLKSAAATRTVPIHPTLLNLGFWEYAQQIATLGHSRLFPDLVPLRRKDGSVKWTHSFSSHRFLRLRRAQGVEKPFHCFRHTVKGFWVEDVVDSEVQKALMGHAREQGAASLYARSARVALDKCDAAIRALNVKGLPEIKLGSLPQSTIPNPTG